MSQFHNSSEALSPEKEIAIFAQSVTVAYRSYNERPSSLKEAALRFLRSGKVRHYSTFNALNQINFVIPKGSVFGIIGGNGSGKSTLLKVLARVLVPTQGQIGIAGAVASLIELGVGFDPELNAIENIYLNGALHKKTRGEIKKRVDHILDFAELREFAHTPIKYYSSGMAARLGFSAAFDINPDILLVDEILAVGDERFQDKCKGVFNHFVNSGKTIVMVSHNMEMLEATADTILLLSKGKMVYLGDPHEAIKRYRSGDYQSALG